MSARKVRVLRSIRAGLVVYFLGAIGEGIYGAVTGAGWSLISFGAAVAFGLVVCYQTALIRRADRPRPTPDYSAIAAMEREVYGRTFEHDGLPREEPPGPPPDH